MSWSRALERKILKSSAHDQVCRFLKKEIPPFTAPKNARQWPKEAAMLRRRALEEVYLHGYTKRDLTAKPRVKWGKIIRPKGAPYIIRKVKYECYPDYWIPALLYEPKKLRGRVPVVLNPNGHHRGGKAAHYKQARCANLARRGMIALNFEFIGQSELEVDFQHNFQSHLTLTGLSGVGLFYLAMSKGLDVLLAHKNADSKRVCMTGLSGGGWQTIVLSALDKRITVSVPVAGYTSIRARVGCTRDIGDYEQCPPDMTTVADYDTYTAMLAPRPTLLITNENDECCFKTPDAKPVIYDAVRPTFKAMNALDNFEHHSNHDPGTHNYEADNRSQLYRFLNKHFGLDTPAHDLHQDSEILTESELKVGIDPSQPTMNQLAAERAVEICAKLNTPRTAYQRKQLRRRLETVIRLPAYTGRITQPKRTKNLLQGRLSVGPWQLPITAALSGKGKATSLHLSDYGRHTWRQHKPGDTNAFATDLLSTGEMAELPRQLMMIESSGHRLLGILVAQTLAAAKTIAARCGVHKIDLWAYGPVTCFVAMLSAGLTPDGFSKVTCYDGLGSLKYLLDWRIPYEQAQPLFCSDLLGTVDVPQIRSLMEGVTISEPSRAVIDEKIATAG